MIDAFRVVFHLMLPSCTVTEHIISLMDPLTRSEKIYTTSIALQRLSVAQDLVGPCHGRPGCDADDMHNRVPRVCHILLSANVELTALIARHVCADICC